MAFPTTKETHTDVADTVTEIVAEHVNFGYGLTSRMQDYIGLEGDTADPNGTLTAQIKDLQDEFTASSFPTAVASATHGPVTTTLSDTSGHDVVAAPGSGLSIYVTQIAATNGAATASLLAASDGTVRLRMRLAATDGAGFVHPFDPPWELPENTALNIAMGTSTTAYITILFYTAAPSV